ncbi:MAG: hypothetical protein RLY97_1398 [Pseudomonadota bacterium]
MGCAILVGANGGIGRALASHLTASGNFTKVICLARDSVPPLDICDSNSIAYAAQHITTLNIPIHLILIATGLLSTAELQPEKSWRDLDAKNLEQLFAVNTIGPAIIMRYFLPLLPREGRCVFAALSARVGSIGDNQLGGWYGYRAAKSALNQIIHTAAIELSRKNPASVCVALHPGTVATDLSDPFAKSGLDVQTPHESASKLLAVIDGLSPENSGGFFDQFGKPIPW